MTGVVSSGSQVAHAQVKQGTSLHILIRQLVSSTCGESRKMGYNPNKDHAKLWSIYLDMMLEFDADFKLPSTDSKKAAYELRRALHGVKVFPKSFPQYQPLLG